MKFLMLISLFSFQVMATEGCMPNYVDSEGPLISEVCPSNDSNTLIVRLNRPQKDSLILSEISSPSPDKYLMELDPRSAKEFKKKKIIIELYRYFDDGACVIEYYGEIINGVEFGWVSAYKADHGC